MLYHLGRITTYTLLGGIVATAGSLTIVAANVENFQKGVMIFTGTLIMLMGLAMAGWLPLGKVLVIMPTQVDGSSNVSANY